MLARAPGDALACDACTTQNVPSDKGVHPIQPRPKRLCSQLRRKRKPCPDGFACSERKTRRGLVTRGDRPPSHRCSNWYTKDRCYRPRTANRLTAAHPPPTTPSQRCAHSRQIARLLSRRRRPPRSIAPASEPAPHRCRLRCSATNSAPGKAVIGRVRRSRREPAVRRGRMGGRRPARDCGRQPAAWAAES